MQVRVYLNIFGRVQGVCFRHYCTQVARRHGLSGWVRNRSDGSVEVVAEGERASLDLLAAWCRHGPPGASVQTCRETYAEATGEFDAFEATG